VGRLAAWIAGGLVVFLVLITAAAAGVVSSVFGGGGADGGGCLGAVTTPGAAPAGLSSEQAHNAGVIVAVGERMRVPVRGWVIAVATALQESDLINTGGGPDDSLGLFQQRPSQGWGTPEQIMNPDYAAGKFYEHLLAVSGWQTMPLTEAAQRVQRSAYPDAYAKHEARATEIVSAYTGGTLPTCDGSAIAASGWTRPVAGTVGSGFRTPDRPHHNGVDLIAARGTVIDAASGGVVVKVRCNIAGNSWDAPFSPSMPCDRDGTGWLPPEIARDSHGYILTGLDAMKQGVWHHEREPFALETSVPGIFAIGDVRSGSVKRVAAAVGEGGMAISFVHRYLQNSTQSKPTQH
jgi:hypothetical protein